MTTQAISGMGTLFQRTSGTTSPYSYTTIAEILTTTGPDKSRATINVTNMDSAGQEELIAGIKSSGTVTLTMNFIEAQYSLLDTDYNSAVARHYKIIYNDTGLTEQVFVGFVTKLSTATKIDGQVMADVTVTVSSSVTLVP